MKKENDQTFLYQLGLHPEISLAELKTVLDLNGVSGEIKASAGFAIAANTSFDAHKPVFEQLGGSPRLLRLIWTFDRNQIEEPQPDDKLLQKITALLRENRPGKITYGVSVFGWPDKAARNLSRSFSGSIKRTLDEQEISSNYASFAHSAYPCLPPAAVFDLMKSKKCGIELCLINLKNTAYLAETVDATDFKPFEKLDMRRPAKNLTSGILPPKLARMMINLAGVSREKQIYDPFCGDGTILMEAARLGHPVAGSDIDPIAVKSTIDNVEWYGKNVFNNISLSSTPVVVDVRNLSAHTGRSSLDCVVTEAHLGPPIRGNFTADKARSTMNNLLPLYKDALREMALALKKRGKIVIALPSFITSGTVHTLRFAHIGIDRDFNVLGHHVYSRPEQKIRREIYVLERKALGD